MIVMCLELKENGMSDADIIVTINNGFEKRRNFFKRIIAVINLFVRHSDLSDGPACFDEVIRRG